MEDTLTWRCWSSATGGRLEAGTRPRSGSCWRSAKTEEKASALNGALPHRGRREGYQYLPWSACDGVVGKGLYRSGIGTGEDFLVAEKMTCDGQILVMSALRYKELK